jgi:exonuclease III
VTLRVLTWNIRAGGGSRIQAIGAALAEQDADILVLTEYRDGPAAPALRAELERLGYRWLTAHTPPRGRNGVLIAARRTFREVGPVTGEVAEPWRLLDVVVGRIRLTGVYMPNLRVKIPYWQALIGALAGRVDGAALAIGDFNTCRPYLDETGATDVTADFLDKVQAAGFRDVWRDRNPETREFIWFSHRQNGFRIDHAFFSPRLAARVRGIGYAHAAREAGVSDHSMLVVDVR